MLSILGNIIEFRASLEEFRNRQRLSNFRSKFEFDFENHLILSKLCQIGWLNVFQFLIFDIFECEYQIQSLKPNSSELTWDCVSTVLRIRKDKKLEKRFFFRFPLFDKKLLKIAPSPSCSIYLTRYCCCWNGNPQVTWKTYRRPAYKSNWNYLFKNMTKIEYFLKYIFKVHF